MADDPKLTAARAQYSASRSKIANLLPALAQAAAGPDVHGVSVLSAAFTKSATSDYRPLLIEPLLRDGAALVGSALAGEASYRQLRIQQINLNLDMDELRALESIHDDEVTAGVFNLSYWTAQATLLTDQAAGTAQNSLATWVQGQMDAQTMNAVWLTENSQKPAGKGWEGNLSDHTPKLFAGKWTVAPTEQSAILGSEPATAGYSVGGVLAYRTVSYSFNYTLQQIATQTASITARQAPVSSRANYLQQDAGFRERRRTVAHVKLSSKLAAIAEPDGPMNYNDRIKAVTAQVTYVTSEAIARLSAVKAGIKLVFGIDCPALPQPAPSTEPVSSPYLFALSQWVQNTVQLLQKAKLEDEAIVHRVSLRSLITDDAWTTGLTNNKWSFTLKPEHFKNLVFVRMRGVSAWCKYGVRLDAWISPALDLVAPSHASAIYPGPGAGTHTASITQSVERCRLGRTQIWYKFPTPPPDVGGQNALFNASPIGNWSVAVANGGDVDGLEDIIFDLFLVAQAV